MKKKMTDAIVKNDPGLDGSIDFSAKYQLYQIRAALNRSHFIPTLFLIFLPPSFSKIRPNLRSLFIHLMKLNRSISPFHFTGIRKREREKDEKMIYVYLYHCSFT